MIARGFVHRKFAPRQELDFADGVEAALCVDIKGPDRLNLVVKQINAVGDDRPHGKEVD